MRVVNEKFETITEYDLTAGKLIPKFAVKEDAEPIDNVKKFAWAEEDWEEVQMYVPNPIETETMPTVEERIVELEEALDMLLNGVTE